MSSRSDALSEGWTKNWSNSQKRPFWFHLATKTSQWHAPTEADAKDPEEARKKAQVKTDAESGGVKRAASTGCVEFSPNKRSKPSTAPFASSSSDSTCLGPSVAIIVPFRDLHAAQNRSAHLASFAPHMVDFLSKHVGTRIQKYRVFIVEQSDDGRKFNRGKLLNIGFDLAKKSDEKFDVFIFHDVDLLPGDDLATYYTSFPVRPMHIARCWGRYSNNPKYFGGIVSFNSNDMRRING